MNANTTTRTALETVTAIRDAMAAAGMPRTSAYAGAELRGWTTMSGSTGFSVREVGDGSLLWHVVVSGKPHLRYHHYNYNGDELHEPTNPERLNPRIQAVFKAQGLSVEHVDYGDHQTMWDDDVGYNVTTARPAWLEPAPAQSAVRTSARSAIGRAPWRPW